jgi:hypothetical protein
MAASVPSAPPGGRGHPSSTSYSPDGPRPRRQASRTGKAGNEVGITSARGGVPRLSPAPLCAASPAKTQRCPGGGNVDAFLGVKGSPVQIRPSRRFFERSYPEMGTRTAVPFPGDAGSEASTPTALSGACPRLVPGLLSGRAATGIPSRATDNLRPARLCPPAPEPQQELRAEHRQPPVLLRRLAGGDAVPRQPDSQVLPEPVDLVVPASGLRRPDRQRRPARDWSLTRRQTSATSIRTPAGDPASSATCDVRIDKQGLAPAP